MFGNFLYFIIVLLIYSSYPASEKTNFSGLETWVLFLGLICVFVFINRIQFYRLFVRISKDPIARLDHKFDILLTRQSILAVVLFAIDIYGLNLTSFFIGIPLFSYLSTLHALLFLSLFIFYQIIVWTYAYNVYQRLYRTDLSRQSYILSNLSVSVPILIPWFVWSVLADIINNLPFDTLNRFLSTTEGQIIYFLVFLLGIGILGPAMIQKFWRCKPLEQGYHRQRIEEICRRANLAYANILYWPIFRGQMITAGVMGLVKKFRYILVTDGLLRYLEPEEIDTVIAHEIGHIKKRHLLYYLLFFIGYMLLSYATFDLVLYGMIYTESIYQFITSAGLDQTTAISILFSLTTILFFFIYFRYVFGFFMRNFERQADTYVYALFDNAQPLISTLEKIALSSGQSPDKPNWHHFSIRERIDYLKKCEQDKKWITRHDNRIRKSMALYLAGMIFAGGLAYSLNFGNTGTILDAHFIETLLLEAIDRTPNDPNLYRELGDLYFSKKDYEKTITAYVRSLILFPNNPHTLNNLAWLYATCEDEKYRDPEKAVRLAERAADLMRESHILDTLAESYYVKGQWDAAVSAAKEALALSKENRNYYETQLEKFQNAKKKADMMRSDMAI